MHIHVVSTSVGNRFALDLKEEVGVHMARRLTPPYTCSFENLTITRQGTVIAEAKIRYVGGFADGPMFYWTDRERYTEFGHLLDAETFQVGDEITIFPDRGRKTSVFFERRFWIEMTNLHVPDNTKMYL